MHLSLRCNDTDHTMPVDVTQHGPRDMRDAMRIEYDSHDADTVCIARRHFLAASVTTLSALLFAGCSTSGPPASATKYFTPSETRFVRARQVVRAARQHRHPVRIRVSQRAFAAAIEDRHALRPERGQGRGRPQLRVPGKQYHQRHLQGHHAARVFSFTACPASQTSPPPPRPSPRWPAIPKTTASRARHARPWFSCGARPP